MADEHTLQEQVITRAEELAKEGKTGLQEAYDLTQELIKGHEEYLASGGENVDFNYWLGMQRQNGSETEYGKKLSAIEGLANTSIDNVDFNIFYKYFKSLK